MHIGDLRTVSRIPSTVVSVRAEGEEGSWKRTSLARELHFFEKARSMANPVYLASALLLHATWKPVAGPHSCRGMTLRRCWPT